MNVLNTTQEQEPNNLGDALPWQIKRVGEIRDEYLQVPGGMFAAEIMRVSINKATRTLASGDVIQMMAAYNELKEYEL